jgi:tetratricopeptide (TPR) repeat protein
MPDRALQVAAEIQADPSLQPLDPKVKVELTFLEAEAWFIKSYQAKAEGVLLSLLDSHPGDTVLLDRTRAVFTAHGSVTNALRIADQQLHFAPDNVSRLLDKGSLCLLAGEFSNAIPLLTRALSLTNSYGGRINRALAYVHLGRLDAAEADYQEARRAFPASYQPYYGLAEVARRRGETNAAIRYYRQYLSKAATDSGETKTVAARLKELQPGAP